MTIHYETASSADADLYIRLRGMTRENAIPQARLHALGITSASWAADIDSGELWGAVARLDGRLVGYGFGNTRSGEVVVLALLPDVEGQGVGRELLDRVVDVLRAHGHERVFLGCSSDPRVRSYGFYRHLGWVSTGGVDGHGDEILERQLAQDAANGR